MLNNKLYFAIVLLTYLSPTWADDFYSKFYQEDYKVDLQRCELSSYNKSVFNLVEVKTFKYNRTQPVVNFTVNSKVNISNEMELVVQFYKFLSNEYRLLPGTRYQVNYCKCVKANIMGVSTSITKCGNYTKCEYVQGVTYKMCNAFPDESKFPPYFPNGEFKIRFELVYHDKTIATIDTYIKIYRPVAVPRKPKTVY